MVRKSSRLLAKESKEQSDLTQSKETVVSVENAADKNRGAQEVESDDSDSDLDVDAFGEKIAARMSLILDSADSESDEEEEANTKGETRESEENVTNSEPHTETFIIDKGHTSLASQKQSSDLTDTDSSEYSSEEESDNDNLKQEMIEVERAKRQMLKDRNKIELTCSLKPNIDPKTMIYTGRSDPSKTPDQKKSLLEKLLPESNNSMQGLMKNSVLTSDYEKKHQILPYKESKRQIQKQRQKERAKTKGKGWFHMPAPEMTEELRNDLTVLKMRRSLDPKRFYKASDQKGLPKYFQMGTVVESAADFYHSRIPKKQRKKTLVDELLADADFRKYNKRKYEEIQETMHRGRSGAHKKMKRMKKNKR